MKKYLTSKDDEASAKKTFIRCISNTTIGIRPWDPFSFHSLNDYKLREKRNKKFN